MACKTASRRGAWKPSPTILPCFRERSVKSKELVRGRNRRTQLAPLFSIAYLRREHAIIQLPKAPFSGPRTL